MNYWLMKSEPDVYSLDHLERDKTTWWEGVRNYQARNFMMKEMKIGDLVLFYHSNAEPSGIAGIARVSSLAQPDKTQFNKKSEYYDEKATKEKPQWFCVQVEYVKKFKQLISLAELRQVNSLAEMLVLQKGSRLSVQPVKEEHFNIVKKLGEH
ncbi:MAG TPA: EVE domain-containing protein [Pseudobdellovibrionaceae bacterium]|jgi:predicted RNA-binding protein with PUA-like domain